MTEPIHSLTPLAQLIEEKLIVSLHLSHSELCRRLGCARSTLSKVLKGQGRLSLKLALKLEALLPHDPQFKASRLLRLSLTSAPLTQEAQDSPALPDESKTSAAGTKKLTGLSLLKISPEDLEIFAANTPQSSMQFPVLLQRLIRTTCPGVLRCEFLGDVDFAKPGPDGIVETAQGSLFVPKGLSHFEVSTKRKAADKMVRDFKGALKKHAPDEFVNFTYLAVTPRTLPKIRRKSVLSFLQDGPFKEAKIYDSQELLQWLNLSPAAQAYFAKITGKAETLGALPLPDVSAKLFSSALLQGSLAELKTRCSPLLARITRALSSPPYPVLYLNTEDEALSCALLSLTLQDLDHTQACEVYASEQQNGLATLPSDYIDDKNRANAVNDTNDLNAVNNLHALDGANAINAKHAAAALNAAKHLQVNDLSALNPQDSQLSKISELSSSCLNLPCYDRALWIVKPQTLKTCLCHNQDPAQILITPASCYAALDKSLVECEHHSCLLIVLLPATSPRLYVCSQLSALKDKLLTPVECYTLSSLQEQGEQTAHKLRLQPQPADFQISEAEQAQPLKPTPLSKFSKFSQLAQTSQHLPLSEQPQSSSGPSLQSKLKALHQLEYRLLIALTMLGSCSLDNKAEMELLSRLSGTEDLLRTQVNLNCLIAKLTLKEHLYPEPKLIYVQGPRLGVYSKKRIITLALSFKKLELNLIKPLLSVLKEYLGSKEQLRLSSPFSSDLSLNLNLNLNCHLNFYVYASLLESLSLLCNALPSALLQDSAAAYKTLKEKTHSLLYDTIRAALSDPQHLILLLPYLQALSELEPETFLLCLSEDLKHEQKLASLLPQKISRGGLPFCSAAEHLVETLQALALTEGRFSLCCKLLATLACLEHASLSSGSATSALIKLLGLQSGPLKLSAHLRYHILAELILNKKLSLALLLKLYLSYLGAPADPANAGTHAYPPATEGKKTDLPEAKEQAENKRLSSDAADANAHAQAPAAQDLNTVYQEQHSDSMLFKPGSVLKELTPQALFKPLPLPKTIKVQAEFSTETLDREAEANLITALLTASLKDLLTATGRLSLPELEDCVLVFLLELTKAQSPITPAVKESRVSQAENSAQKTQTAPLTGRAEPLQAAAPSLSLPGKQGTEQDRGLKAQPKGKAEPALLSALGTHICTTLPLLEPKELVNFKLYLSSLLKKLPLSSATLQNSDLLSLCSLLKLSLNPPELRPYELYLKVCYQAQLKGSSEPLSNNQSKQKVLSLDKVSLPEVKKQAIKAVLESFKLAGISDLIKTTELGSLIGRLLQTSRLFSASEKKKLLKEALLTLSQTPPAEAYSCLKAEEDSLCSSERGYQNFLYAYAQEDHCIKLAEFVCSMQSDLDESAQLNLLSKLPLCSELYQRVEKNFASLSERYWQSVPFRPFSSSPEEPELALGEFIKRGRSLRALSDLLNKPYLVRLLSKYSLYTLLESAASELKSSGHKAEFKALLQHKAQALRTLFDYLNFEFSGNFPSEQHHFQDPALSLSLLEKVQLELNYLPYLISSTSEEARPLSLELYLNLHPELMLNLLPGLSSQQNQENPDPKNKEEKMQTTMMSYLPEPLLSEEEHQDCFAGSFFKLISYIPGHDEKGRLRSNLLYAWIKQAEAAVLLQRQDLIALHRCLGVILSRGELDHTQLLPDFEILKVLDLVNSPELYQSLKESFKQSLTQRYLNSPNCDVKALSVRYLQLELRCNEEQLAYGAQLCAELSLFCQSLL